MGKEAVSALEDVTLNFCNGDIVAIVGANGSGKTSLLRILTGVNRPSTGTARILGCNTRCHKMMKTSKRTALKNIYVYILSAILCR